MSHDPENPFADFDENYKNAEAAKPGSVIGRLPEFNAYKGVCTSVDLEGDGKLVDKHIFEAGTGTKALKIFIEVLSPEKVGDVVVKGEVHEHVFWVSDGMLPYIKRDATTIQGKPVESMKEFAQLKWAGKTFEFGLKDDTYNGFVRSKVTFFNSWTPESKKETKKETAPAKTESAPKGAPKSKVSF